MSIYGIETRMSMNINDMKRIVRIESKPHSYNVYYVWILHDDGATTRIPMRLPDVCLTLKKSQQSLSGIQMKDEDREVLSRHVESGRHLHRTFKDG